MASASSGPRRKHHSGRRRPRFEDDFNSLDPTALESHRPHDYYVARHRPQDRPAHARAQVHGAQPRYPQAAAAQTADTQPPPSWGRPRPSPRTPPVATDEPPRNLYRKKDESSSSTIDMEMVEMRHPERLHRSPEEKKQEEEEEKEEEEEEPSPRPPAQGRRTYQKYAKSPSSDSTFRPANRIVRASAYSTLSVKSWSELDTEISVVVRDLNKVSPRRELA